MTRIYEKEEVSLMKKKFSLIRILKEKNKTNISLFSLILSLLFVLMVKKIYAGKNNISLRGRKVPNSVLFEAYFK